MYTDVGMPWPCSVFALTNEQGSVDNSLLVAELKAHLQFTIAIESFIVVPGISVLADRASRDPRTQPLVPQLERIVADEGRHAEQALNVLAELDGAGRQDLQLASEVHKMVTGSAPSVGATDQTVFFALASESLVSTHLGEARRLRRSTPSAMFLRHHASDEARHSRIVRRLLARLLADQDILCPLAGSFADRMQCAEALGFATRDYASLFIRTLRRLRAEEMPDGSQLIEPLAYGRFLSEGLVPCWSGDTNLERRFQMALTAAPLENS